MLANLLSPPSGWPDCFNAPELQSYIADTLKGQRVRLCAQAGPADLAKVSKLKVGELSATDTLANAEKVRKATGWDIIGGYILFERTDASAGNRYTAERRWWNAKKNKDGSS